MRKGKKTYVLWRSYSAQWTNLRWTIQFLYLYKHMATTQIKYRTLQSFLMPLLKSIFLPRINHTSSFPTMIDSCCLYLNFICSMQSYSMYCYWFKNQYFVSSCLSRASQMKIFIPKLQDTQWPLSEPHIAYWLLLPKSISYRYQLERVKKKFSLKERRYRQYILKKMSS